MPAVVVTDGYDSRCSTRKNEQEKASRKARKIPSPHKLSQRSSYYVCEGE
jgi:hypothetical protein